MTLRDRRGGRVVAAALAALLVGGLVACGDEPDPARGGAAARPTTPTPSASSDAPSTPAPTSVPFVPTAAEQLAAYVAAAERVDVRLRAVARVVNASVTADGAAFDAETVTLLRDADPAAIEALLPAGMPPQLLRPVLLVHSDLVSRHAALRWVEQGRLAPEQVQQLVECLPNGGPAARRFADDLAAARAEAARTAALPDVPGSARAAGELAVRLAELDLANTGCGACGGAVAETLPSVVWDSGSSGRIGELGFTAGWTGARWDVAFDAC